MSPARRRGLLYASAVVAAGALLFAGFGITIPPDPVTRLSGAALVANAGDVDRALAMCAQVLREHPDDFDARVYRATFLTMAERWDEADAAFRDAFAYAPDERAIRRDLRQDHASMLLAAGRRDAFQGLRDRLARDREDHRVRVLDGLAACADERWADAVAAFETARAMRPDDAPLRARLWTALMRDGERETASGRFTRAAERFERASALFPSATDAHRRAAEARLAAGDTAAALAALEGVPSSTPGLAPLLFRAATERLRDGDEDGAFAALAAAFRADAAAARALFDRETVWMRLRDDPRLQDARAEVEKDSGAGLTAPK